VVSDLICADFGKVSWATNSPEALSVPNPAVDSLFVFTARPFDEDSPLQNNLNRWYDARVGRWLSEDPVGFAAGDGNVYRYVGNIPIGKLDSAGTGECALINPKSPSVKYAPVGPQNVRACAARLGITPGTNPSTVGAGLANTLLCVRERTVHVLYCCKDIIFEYIWFVPYKQRTVTTSVWLSFTQTETWVLHLQRPEQWVPVVSVEVPLPAPWKGPGANLAWYQIDPTHPDYQRQADSYCYDDQRDRPWKSFTPPTKVIR